MLKNLSILLTLSACCLQGLTQSQTRTAALFNWNGNPYANYWQEEGAPLVAANDNIYAYSKKLTKHSALSLVLQDFNFEIPSGATIDNITVTVHRFKKGTASARDYFASLLKQGSGFYNPSQYGIRWMDPSPYPNAEAAVTYTQSGYGNNGGSGNQLYEWTPSLINDPSFGVRIDTYSPVKGSLVVYYDYVNITVLYTESSITSAGKFPASAEVKPLKAPIAFPNPFTTNTNIRFTATETGIAVVELFNLSGVKIQTIFSGKVVQGQQYNIVAGQAGLSKGVYMYRITNGQRKHTGRIVKID